MDSEDETASRSHPIIEDMPLQRKVWLFERVGWYGLMIVVILTLLGLFSDGPLSHQEVRSKDGRLRLEYERFSRNGASENMIINVQGEPDSQIEVLIGGSLLKGMTLESLQPQPLRSTSQGGALNLQLRTDFQGIATLYLNLRSENTGIYSTTVSVGPTALQLRKFIYP